MNATIEELLGSLSGAAIGAYAFSVVWHGNTKTLGTYLMQEEGYVEFIVALLILGAVDRWGPTGKVASAITTMTIIAILVKIGMNSNLNQNLAKFASGQTSALDTIKALLQGR
jgi:hypothetical protein